MYESFALRMMYDCTSCGSGFPINGLAESVDCPQCGHHYNFGVNFWTSCFDEDALEEARGLEPGQLRTVNSMSNFGTMQYHYGPALPACPECETPVALDFWSETKNPEAKEIVCGACEFPIALRPANDIARAISPSARYIANERGIDPDALEVERKTEPVMFACLQCGAGLQVDGSSRNVTCQFCEAGNYLPEGLWRQLNPVPTASYFYLLLQLSEEKAQQKRMERDLALAANPDQGDAEAYILALIKLTEHPSLQVRTTLAENTKNPVLLEILAQDAHPKVRSALIPTLFSGAVDQAHTAKLVELLSKDPDPKCRFVLASQTQDSDLVERLARDANHLVRSGALLENSLGPSLAGRESLLMEIADGDDDDAKLRLAENLSTPEAVLMTLCRDGNAAVRQAARQTLGPRAPRNPAMTVAMILLAIIAVAFLAAFIVFDFSL